MANNKSPSSNPIDKDSLEISDFLTKRYRGVSVYGAVMILLAIGIIWTAVLTAEQVQQYHEDYMALQKMKVEHRNLQIENQRLVIEQQTLVPRHKLPAVRLRSLVCIPLQLKTSLSCSRQRLSLGIG